MNLGDTFVDSSRCNWTVESELGHGLWCRSWKVKDENGRFAVLKIALSPRDFPDDLPVPADVIRGCREAAREQAALLSSGRHPFLPKLLSSLTLTAGAPALLVSWYESNLAERIGAGMPLHRVVAHMTQISQWLGKSRFIHGNLRPSNVLFNERGEPVLADPLTPAVASVLHRLEAISVDRERWRPPEAAPPPSAMWDTWGICQILYLAALHRESAADAQPCRSGLDKVEIATVKDRALARFSSEPTNPRFRSRMAERLGAVLHRGLSEQTEPSPPFRFVDAKALSLRLAEVDALVAPRVEDVGRLLPEAEFVSGVYQDGDAIRFSVSVGCTAGVTQHEDVVCGMQMLDLDAGEEGRVPLTDAEYKAERHRSGRLRFQFMLPNLHPGRYRLKIAFTVRDSGLEPEVAVGEFQVRPTPGYVPPPQVQDNKAPIVLDRVRIHAPAPTAASSAPSSAALFPSTDVTLAVGTSGVATAGPTTAGVPTGASDPGAEVIEGLFPRPIAPPSDQPSHPPMGRQTRPEAPRSRPEPMPLKPAAMYHPPSRPPIPMVRPSLRPGPDLGNRPQASAHTAPPMAHDTLPPAAVIPSTSGAPALAPVLEERPIAPPSLPVPPPALAPAPPRQEPFEHTDPAVRDWYAGQLPDFGIEADGLLPSFHEQGEDLPSWNPQTLLERLRRVPGVDELYSWIQRDAYTALFAAIAVSFVTLLLLTALLKAL